MAKQYGIHQLKGKVGQMSYYRQSGVKDSLVRGINQGMSGRVKTSDEYINTRLNNAEFKEANKIATFIYRSIWAKNKAMIRRFALADMTKAALGYVKQGPGRWGERVPARLFDQIAVDLVDNHAKLGTYDGQFGLLSAHKSQDDMEIDLSLDNPIINALIEKGFSGFRFFAVAIMMAQDNAGREIDTFFFRTLPYAGDVDLTHVTSPIVRARVDVSTGSDFVLVPTGAWSAASDCDNNGMAALVSFVPYYEVDGVHYDSFENSTLAVISLGQSTL